MAKGRKLTWRTSFMRMVMVPSATKKVRAAVSITSALIDSPADQASPSFSTPAPAIAGMPSRKAKRAASGRSKPSARAAVMVMPERLVPGMMAIAWATPMISAGDNVMSDMRRIEWP